MIFLNLVFLAKSQLILSVSPQSTLIVQSTTYTFTISPLTILTVPVGAYFEITFPSQYSNLPTSPSCSPITWSNNPTLQCSTAGNVLRIANGFPSSSNSNSYSFTVQSITNPFPAQTTNAFNVQLRSSSGSSLSSQSSSNNPTVTSVMRTLSCSFSFSTAPTPLSVAAGQISFTNVYSFSKVTITAPNFYPNDLLQSSNINLQALGATTTTFSQTQSLSITTSVQPISISIRAPPSVQAVTNFLTLITSNSQGNIETCRITVSGTIPGQILSRSVSTAKVQSISQLLVQFTIPTQLTQDCTITLKFPSQVPLETTTTQSVSGAIGVFGVLQFTLQSNSNSLIVSLSGTGLTADTNTQLGLSITNIVFPFTTATTASLQITTAYLGNVIDQVTSGLGITATPGSISVAVTPFSLQITSISSYSLKLTFPSQLAATNKLVLAIPQQLSFTDSICISLSSPFDGGSCIYSGNTLTLTKFISGGSAIPQLSFAVTLRNPGQIGQGSQFIVSTFSQGNLVDQGKSPILNYITHSLLPSEYTFSSSASTTLSPATFSLSWTSTVPATLSFSISMTGSDCKTATGVNLQCSSQNNLLTISGVGGSINSITFLGVTPRTVARTAFQMKIFGQSGTYLIATIFLQMNSLFQLSASSQQSNQVVGDSSAVTISISNVNLESADVITVQGTVCANNMGFSCSNSGSSAKLIANSFFTQPTTISLSSINPAFIGTNAYSVALQNGKGKIAEGSWISKASTAAALTVTVTIGSPFLNQPSNYNIIIRSNIQGAKLTSVFPIEYPLSSFVMSPVSGLISPLTNFPANTRVFSVSVNNRQSSFALSNVLNPKTASSQWSFSLYDSSERLVAVGKSAGFTTACTLPCRQCTTTLTQCRSCYTWGSNPLLNSISNTCDSSCPSGQYVSNNICVNCLNPCATCTSQADCLTCVANRFLKETTCVAGCPSNYFQEGGSCLKCDAVCLTCNSNGCLSCSGNLNLQSNNCIQICLQGYFPSNNLCVSCSLNCKVCASPTSCATCIQNFPLLNGLCQNACPTRYISQSNVCVGCESPCLTCVDNINNCLSCRPDLNPQQYFLENKCYQNCPIGYFTQSGSLKCVICKSTCYACTPSLCTFCQLGFLLWNGDCVDRCPSQALNINGNCMRCLTSCVSCINNLQFCQSCSSNNFLMGGKCYTTCPDLYYSSGLTCLPCKSPCGNCQGTQTSCTSCVSNFNLLGSDCISQCPIGYFTSSFSVCVKCLTGCAACSSSSCITCSPNFLIFNGQCVSTCPSGSYPEGIRCSSCSPCQVCSGINMCTSCQKPFLLLGTQCIQNCPSNMFPQQGACKSCSSVCKTCLGSSTYCAVCSTGFAVTGICVAMCPQNYYGIQNQCKSCALGCRNCNSTVSCLNGCISNFYNFKDGCYKACPPQAPLILNGAFCQSCFVSNCIQCKSDNSSFCLKCNSTSFYANSTGVCVLTIFGKIAAGNIVPVPMTLTFLVGSLILFLIKQNYKKTHLPSSILWLGGPIELITLILLAIFSKDYGVTLGASVSALAAIVVMNLLALLFLNHVISTQRHFQVWSRSHKKTVVVLRTVMAILNFRIGWLLFSNFMDKDCFSAALIDLNYLKGWRALLMASVLMSLTLIICSSVGLYLVPQQNQFFFECIDCFMVQLVLMAASIIQLLRPQQQFNQSIIRLYEQELVAPLDGQKPLQDLSVQSEQKSQSRKAGRSQRQHQNSFVPLEEVQGSVDSAIERDIKCSLQQNKNSLKYSSEDFNDEHRSNLTSQFQFQTVLARQSHPIPRTSSLKAVQTIRQTIVPRQEDSCSQISPKKSRPPKVKHLANQEGTHPFQESAKKASQSAQISEMQDYLNNILYKADDYLFEIEDSQVANHGSKDIENAAENIHKSKMSIPINKIALNSQESSPIKSLKKSPKKIQQSPLDSPISKILENKEYKLEKRKSQQPVLQAKEPQFAKCKSPLRSESKMATVGPTFQMNRGSVPQGLDKERQVQIRIVEHTRRLEQNQQQLKQHLHKSKNEQLQTSKVAHLTEALRDPQFAQSQHPISVIQILSPSVHSHQDSLLLVQDSRQHDQSQEETKHRITYKQTIPFTQRASLQTKPRQHTKPSQSSQVQFFNVNKERYQQQRRAPSQQRRVRGKPIQKNLSVERGKVLASSSCDKQNSKKSKQSKPRRVIQRRKIGQTSQSDMDSLYIQRVEQPRLQFKMTNYFGLDGNQPTQDLEDIQTGKPLTRLQKIYLQKLSKKPK